MLIVPIRKFCRFAQAVYALVLIAQQVETKVQSALDKMELAAKRGQNLGGLTTGLLHLLDLYGAVELELEQAITEAVSADACHLAAVRQVLERRRREQNLEEPVAIAVPADPRIQNMVVIPHDLAGYDKLQAASEEVSHDGRS